MFPVLSRSQLISLVPELGAVPGILSTFAKEQLPCWLYKAEDGEDQEVPDLMFRLPYCYSSSVFPRSLWFGGILQQAEDV